MDINETIRDNISRLMKAHGWKPKDLAKHAGISPRHANYVPKGGRSPGVEVLTKIANAFRVTVFQLVTPNLPDDVLFSPSVYRLLRNYADASTEGRELIEMQAQREADIQRGRDGKAPPLIPRLPQNH